MARYAFIACRFVAVSFLVLNQRLQGEFESAEHLRCVALFWQDGTVFSVFGS